jgi:hypothetical protein
LAVTKGDQRPLPEVVFHVVRSATNGGVESRLRWRGRAACGPARYGARATVLAELRRGWPAQLGHLLQPPPWRHLVIFPMAVAPISYPRLCPGRPAPTSIGGHARLRLEPAAGTTKVAWLCRPPASQLGQCRRRPCRASAPAVGSPTVDTPGRSAPHWFRSCWRPAPSLCV